MTKYEPIMQKWGYDSFRSCVHSAQRVELSGAAAAMAKPCRELGDFM